MSGSNEVACGRASRHPGDDLDFGPVNKTTENGSLVVEYSRTIFATAGTIDEQSSADPEDRAGVPRYRRLPWTPCREWHSGT